MANRDHLGLAARSLARAFPLVLVFLLAPVVVRVWWRRAWKRVKRALGWRYRCALCGFDGLRVSTMFCARCARLLEPSCREE